MFNIGNVCIFNTMVQPMTDGTKTFTAEDKIIDIGEFRKCLSNLDNVVMIKNDVSKWSSGSKVQCYINTDVLYPEDGFEESYTFTHYGRSLAMITNRKMRLSFKGTGKDAVMKATYFDD